MTGWELEDLREQGIKTDEGMFYPVFWIEEVQEPEFGCEGRPEGIVITGTVIGRTPEEYLIFPVEEKLLYNSGLDDNMLLGYLKKSKYETVPGYIRGTTGAFCEMEPAKRSTPVGAFVEAEVERWRKEAEFSCAGLYN